MIKVGDRITITRKDSVIHLGVIGVGTGGVVTKVDHVYVVGMEKRPYFVKLDGDNDTYGETTWAGTEIKKVKS